MAYETYISDPVADATIVTLEQAKMNSKIEFDDEDALLEIFVDAATNEIENYIGGPVLPREASSFVLSKWCRSLKAGPRVEAIESVTYVDDEGEEQELAADDYYLIKNTNTIVITADEPVDFEEDLTINCTLGYTTIPADIKRAALLIFSNADTYRENMPIKLNTAAQALLRPYKIY
ncbi:MAG TPA: head-tail connector protein [Salinimicrobium sp.]|nr:head-tail connector protein [Salinimicrobium sp.]